MRFGRRLLWFAAGLVVASGSIALGQAAVQTAATQGSGQTPYTLRARVPLTIVDVVVTDAAGKPVHGLKLADFTLLEDGKEMKPASFDEHRSDEAADVAVTSTELKLPPNNFSNASVTPKSTSPLNVLILDSMDTPIATQSIVQMRMVGFVDKLTPDKRVAVLNISAMGQLSILQGFTSDHVLLKAAINSKKITGQIPPIEDSLQEPPAGNIDPTEQDPDVQCNHAAMRGQYSLSAMQQIVRYLSGMSGRKNVLWYSGSFPLTMEDKNGGVCYDFTQDLQVVNDQLARAHIALYPIDPRAMDLIARYGMMSKPVLQQVQEHLTQESIAEQTGGKALYNNNDLAALATDAVDLGSNFYTLTYTPVNQAMDTRFRTIKVKVDQPGLHLDYRNGYYAVEPDVTLAGKKIVKLSPMQSAMMRGGLDATQILFKVAVQEAHGTEDKLAADNQPDARWMKPPYRRYTVSYAVDVHGIDFATTPDGNYRGDFEYGVRVYNADGDEVVNSASKTVSPILPPTVYRSMLKGGANAHLEIDVPATGDYFLRIAVHDLASDRVGSIEVATSAIHAETASGK
jgi:VWFA-related protein